MDVKPLPTQRVSSLPPKTETGWLIEHLWLENACGIIGGQPKCCKSWLGLEMALAVASGKPCLGRFRVPTSGPALVFMAEDRLEEVYARVAHLAKARNIPLETLDMHLITAPVVRLDDAEDCQSLHETLARLKPRILLMDPLVRLHRLDENSAREISGLLGFLRELERRHGVAVVLTHHASKRAHARPGQGLRGSSDLHAFGDSNIYLCRKGDELELAVEHRSASAMDPIALRLATEPAAHLTFACGSESQEKEMSLRERIVKTLEREQKPWTRAALREELKVNNQRLGLALQELLGVNRIALQDGHYRGVP